MNRNTGLVLAGSILFIFLLGLSSCKHEPFIAEDDDMMVIDTTGNPPDTLTGTPCDPETVYFTLDVLPILQSNCAISGCHDPITAQEGYMFTSYENVIQAEEVVIPFDISESKMYEAITDDELSKRMPPPPYSALTGDQIDLIATWILQGAQDLECDPNFGECITESVSFSQTVQPILQNTCVGCHSGGAPQAGIDLSTHSGVAQVAANGRLVGAISHAAGYEPMPQGGNQLPQCTIDQITAWVNDGAPNN